MRISDWTSDVCSSDLSRLHLPRRGIAGHLRPQAEEGRVMPADKHDGILQIRDLSLAFRTPAGRLKVLRDISLDLGRGRILGIVGESGCGKSTLISPVMRLLPSHAEVTRSDERRVGKGCGSTCRSRWA